MGAAQPVGLFIGLVGALVVGIVVVVWHNGHDLGVSPAASRGRALLVALLLVGWLAAMGVLATRGFFAALMTRFPPPLALALVPPWITLLCCVAVPALRRYLIRTPLTWLIGFQVFRVGIEYVLWLLHHQGEMPRAMTFEGQNIDLVVGATAPLIAVLVARPRSWTPLLALVWNVLALLILFNTIRVAFQSVPGVFYKTSMQPPNTIVGQFPFIWLPAFVVPVAALGHLLAIAQVLSTWSAKNTHPTTTTETPLS